jgi:GAF domain-containing protein
VEVPDQTLRELQALAGVVLGQESLSEALDEVCRIAVRAVPGTDGASITSFTEGGPRAVAASDPWAEALDELQHAEHEGPCLDAARTGLVFRIRDIGEELRWPSYAPRAVERGVQSMVSLPMTTESKTLGALNMYSRRPDAFSAEEISVAEILAGHASLATQVAAALFHHQALAEQLREAMTSRASIEQAKGILMATAGCGADEAFELLKQQSQHDNRKLRDVADDLIRQQRRG